MPAESQLNEQATNASAAGSELVEAAARARDFDVVRLSPEVLVCTGPQHRVAFKGLAGSGVGQVSYFLCRDQAALRSHLESRGLRMLDVAAEPPEQVAHVAVVGGRGVAQSVAAGDLAASAPDLARKVAAALPGAAYCSVVVALVDGEPAVVSVDPLLQWWARTEPSEASRKVAEAILDWEFECGH